jgi:hypothetical protein
LDGGDRMLLSLPLQETGACSGDGTKRTQHGFDLASNLCSNQRGKDFFRKMILLLSFCAALIDHEYDI